MFEIDWITPDNSNGRNEPADACMRHMRHVPRHLLFVLRSIEVFILLQKTT